MKRAAWYHARRCGVPVWSSLVRIRRVTILRLLALHCK